MPRVRIEFPVEAFGSGDPDEPRAAAAASSRPAPPESGITREWLHREYAVKLRSIDTLARDRGVSAVYLKNLAGNWGLPVRRHSDFSGIGHLDLPAPPSSLICAVVLDALVIRNILVPAWMTLNGRANWWLPAWLNRRLPRLTVEPPAAQKLSAAHRAE